MSANKRGQRVALAALGLQAVLIALATGLWMQTRSAATWPALWLIVAPAPVWLLTAVLFYCRWLRDLESEELRQLSARGGDQEGLFAGEDVSQQPAANRLRWIGRYLVPAFTLAYAGYHLALGVLALRWLRSTETFASSAPAGAFFAVGGAFFAFLMSRYTTGMAKVPAWRPLRAAGSYLFADTLTLVVLAATLGLEAGGVARAGRVVGYVLSLLLVVLGVELLMNFVLDLYRPRVPDAERRFSFDSRLLNILASPESIGHSIAEALNYQFGFEVSSSWFYRLLQRALVPLLLAGGLVVWLMTSIVVVREGQTYVVLRFGQKHRRLQARRLPHLTMPWPIDTARKFETSRIHEIVLGVGGERQEEFIRGRRVYLWAAEHGPRDELNTLVAVPPRATERAGGGGAGDGQTPNVMLIKLVVNVYYRVADPYRFGYDFTAPEKLLEAVAYREMVRYAASATLDERLPAGAGTDRPQGIMSFGREQAAERLRDRIAAAVNRPPLDLGVDIVRVELTGCHPPKEAAPAFEDVIAAERERDRMRYEAQAEAGKVLAEVAGDAYLAWTFAQAIGFRNDLRDIRRALAAGRSAEPEIERAIRSSRAEVERLQRELAHQRLLGRLPDATPSDDEEGQARRRPPLVQTLLDAQRGHLALLEALRGEGPPAALREALLDAERGVAVMFDGLGGRCQVIRSQAMAYRWQTEFRERALVATFPVEMKLLQMAPSLYRQERLLAVLSEALAGQRKYILAMDRDRVEVWWNLEDETPVLPELAPLTGTGP